MKVSKQHIKSLLNGDLFRTEAIRKQYPLLGLLAVLTMVYILADYHAIDQQKQIIQMRRQINESRFEYLSIYTELVRVSRQTVVIDQLEEKGSSLEMNMRPLIEIDNPSHE
jgi:hypothetical protein